MPPPYCYPYPRPAVAVDLVVFCIDDDRLRTLFIRRKSDPFRGRWALPGGFLDMDEPIEAAAVRELREETGLEAGGLVAPIGVFGDPGRDPRGRTLSLAHAGAIRGPLPPVEGRDDAAEAAWLDPRTVDNLAFDHDKIVMTGIEWLARGVTEGPVGLALLPAEFGKAEVRSLLKAVEIPTRRASTWLHRQVRIGRIAPIDDEGEWFSPVDPDENRVSPTPRGAPGR